MRPTAQTRTALARLGRVCLAAPLAALALAGCDSLGVSTPTLLKHSPEDASARNAYQAVQDRLRTEGRLQGGGGEFTAAPADLAAQFEDLAFGSSDAAILQRWSKPVRIALRFGDSVPLPTRSKDRAVVSSLVSNLSHFAGHPISLGNRLPEIRVFVMNAAEMAEIGETARSVAGGPESANCTMRPEVNEPPETGLKAVDIYIRSELPDLMRQSCYREQIARGLGLFRGKGSRLPSLLSLGREYADLASHDYLILRMLYDPRLRSGMSRSEARSAIVALATELGTPEERPTPPASAGE